MLISFEIIDPPEVWAKFDPDSISIKLVNLKLFDVPNGCFISSICSPIILDIF